MEKLNIGVLGYAFIARTEVLPAICKARNCVPYAIASRSAEKLREAKGKFRFQKTYESYDELLADEAVHAVYIPLPNTLHKEWVIKAAKAGKHILCEKPLALTAGDCEEMAAVCEENRVNLQEAFMYRFSNRAKKLQELLAAGVIGEVKSIHSSFRFLLEDMGNIRVSPELGGGRLWDIGCYPVNIIGLVTGMEPETISAQMVARNGVDISLSAILSYPGGVIASLSCGFDAQSVRLTEISGTEGTLILPDSFGDSDEPVWVIDRNGLLKEYPVEKCERYVLQVEDFARAVLEGRPATLPPAETVRNVRVIQRILAAARH